MDKEQAHQILVKVTAMLKLNRADHNAVNQALETLRPERAKEKK